MADRDAEQLRTESDTLVALGERVFAAGQIEMAYHALAAALHGAETLGDAERMSKVVDLAHEQLAWLDAHRPEHPHASAGAAARGNPGVYAGLVVQANAALIMVRSGRARAGPA